MFADGKMMTLQAMFQPQQSQKNYSYKNNLINKHPTSVSCQAFLMSMHGTFLYVSVLRLYTPK